MTSVELLWECLRQANGDTEAGLLAYKYILANGLDAALATDARGQTDNTVAAPVVDNTVRKDEDSKVLSRDVALAHDISNRRAQGILNDALQSAHGLSAAARRELKAALARGAESSGPAILNFVEKYRFQLAKLLTATQLAAVLEGTREVAGKVPALEDDRRALGDVPQPTFPVEDGVHLPVIEEAARSLAERNVLTRHGYDALEAAARAKAFTVAAVDSAETLGKIRDVLAENVRSGASYEAFKSKVLDAVDQGTFLSDAHNEAVFRTNVQTAFSDGQMTALQHPLVQSGFPYSAYDAIHDDRTRPNHLALEKCGIGGTNVYRSDDPVFRTFRPPWDYNDRCSWTPLTIRQAAEAGVPEAQRWLDTGVPPAEPTHVAMPPFAPPPEFQHSISSMPLSVRLSLQPMAVFATDKGGREHRGKGEGGGQFTGKGGGNGSPPRPKRTTQKKTPTDTIQVAESLPAPVLTKSGPALVDEVATAAESLRPGYGSRVAAQANIAGKLRALGGLDTEIFDKINNDPATMARLKDAGLYAHNEYIRGLADAYSSYQRDRNDPWMSADAKSHFIRNASNTAVASVGAAMALRHLGYDREANFYETYVPEMARRLAKEVAETPDPVKTKTPTPIQPTTTSNTSPIKQKGFFTRLLDRIGSIGSPQTRARRKDEGAFSLKEGDEPEEESTDDHDALPHDASDKEDEGDRIQLIAEILVILFGDEAEEVAEELRGMPSGASLATSGGPQVKKRYGRQPGPGWVSGGTSRLGTPIWLWTSSATRTPASARRQRAARTPTPTPAPVPTPAPAPAPPVPTPAPVPTPRGGGVAARAASVAAHAAVMTKLNAGQALTAADRAALARKLTNMPVGLLRSLHSALGGTASVSGARNLVTAVRNLLTGSTPVPTPPPVPAPPPIPPASAPTPPTPAATNAISPGAGISQALDDVEKALLAGQPLSATDKATLTGMLPRMTHRELQSLYSALTGRYTAMSTLTVIGMIQSILNPTPTPAPVPPSPTPAPAPPPTPAPAPQPLKFTRPPIGSSTATQPPVPYADETSWEVGVAKPGSLNGIDFAPAPKKFWEHVADVDIGEPKPLPGKKVDRAGILIQEPDGRVWIVQPTNAYGDRKYTWPGGGVEPGLTDQQNALKEVWEETGLQCEITGHVGDFEDSNRPGLYGRLYIGKRTGGAPWDAKIESHITNRKTGKPAAESENVVLVTPERAAKLLHRTDDLAQLMAAHPPPIDTPTRGKGSEPLKKFVDAIKPAAKAYETKAVAGGMRAGKFNADLHALQDLRGFNNKPKVVSKADMDALVAKGDHIEVMRGVQGAGSKSAKDVADEFRTGDHFAGTGVFGSGTYTDSTKGSGNAALSHYSGYGSGALIRMALPKTAKIINQSELEKKVPVNPAGFHGYSGHGQPHECWQGVQAALAGYDAIYVDGKSTRHYSYGKGFYVILNRSIVTVQKEDAAGHVIR